MTGRTGLTAGDKVLITGGAGFIGSTVASACLDAGLVPVILDNLSTGRREFTEGRIFYEGDIADAALLDLVFAEHPDLAATVHCAALTIVPESVANPIRYYRENVTKTLELIEGLVRNDCRRLVFSSSASVYAAGSSGKVDENAPLGPASPYARTKAITEWVLEDVARAGDVRAIALRYFNPIGADPEFRTGNPNPEPPHVLGKMITAYQSDEPFHITGVDWPTRDGSAIRDYIHVWDLAEAHVAALHNFDAIVARHAVPGTRHSAVPYEVINLGTGDGTTVRELADAFQDVVPGGLEVLDAPRRPGDVIGAYTGTAKARQLLGWAPQYSVAEGIRDALAWARVRAGMPAPTRQSAAADARSSARASAVVDVLMPYYGDVAMMQEAVRSVLAQRDPHWRLTVVDDGTEPGVPEWFAALIAEHGPDKISYERNETNLGITGNFQKCLSLVTQPLVTMIGSDDRMLPDYIGTVRALMRDYPRVCLAQPGVEVIDENGEVVEPWVDKVKRRVYAPRFRGALVLGGESLAVSLLRGNWMYFPAICWRADVITEVGFNPNLRVVQDLALTLEWVRAGAQIVVSDTVCFQYRRHAVSVSSERAHSGARFAEERDFFLDEAVRMDGLGWRHAARAARLHLSSRLHAATLLPGALRRGSRNGVRTLAAYAFGPTRRGAGGSAAGSGAAGSGSVGSGSGPGSAGSASSAGSGPGSADSASSASSAGSIGPVGSAGSAGSARSAGSGSSATSTRGPAR
nr:UDP-glucose 4-epimerase GalE [Catenulispora pinisilvae]